MKGFQPKEGVEYSEIFSLVVKFTRGRLAYQLIFGIMVIGFGGGYLHKATTKYWARKDWYAS